MENIIGCVGPMANCVEDLRLFCQVALAYQPWDYEPSLIEMPWKSISMDDLPQKLVIGVMWHDGIVRPHPPVTRALRETVKTLRASGHTIVDWDPKQHPSLLKWIKEAYFLDGAQEYHDSLVPSVDPAVPVIKWLLETQAGKRSTLEESWQLNKERDLLRTLYANQWRSTGIDVLLCPVNPSVASAHDESKHWGYTSAFNALDLPGTVFPVSVVKDDDALENGTPVLSEKDEEYRDFYKSGASKYRDAPISLQLVGKRLQEEKLLAMTEAVQKSLNEGRTRGTTAVSHISSESVPTLWRAGHDVKVDVVGIGGEKRLVGGTTV